MTGGESTAHKLAHKEVECLDTNTGKWNELPHLKYRSAWYTIDLVKKEIVYGLWLRSAGR